jgi:nicotinamidase/pyrazinamidase
MKNTAHFIVDMENDFVMPQWTLYVTGAEKIIQPIDQFAKDVAEYNIPTICSEDQHTPDHISFASRFWIQPITVWPDGEMKRPDHCIVDTWWAQLAWVLDESATKYNRQIIKKATTRDYDTYSAFGWTWLDAILRAQWISHLLISWVATDYCVKQTALDAVKYWFQATIMTDLVAWIAQWEQLQQVYNELTSAWVVLKTTEQLKQELKNLLKK